MSLWDLDKMPYTHSLNYYKKGVYPKVINMFLPNVPYKVVKFVGCPGHN